MGQEFSSWRLRLERGSVGLFPGAEQIGDLSLGQVLHLGKRDARHGGSAANTNKLAPVEEDSREK